MRAAAARLDLSVVALGQQSVDVVAGGDGVGQVVHSTVQVGLSSGDQTRISVGLGSAQCAQRRRAQVEARPHRGVAVAGSLAQLLDPGLGYQLFSSTYGVLGLGLGVGAVGHGVCPGYRGAFPRLCRT